MTLQIEAARDRDAVTEFCEFHDRVYAYRSAYWPANVLLHTGTLLGELPFSDGRTFHPLVARLDGEIVARACAVVDRHYIDHWGEPLGHVAMFEALPDTRDATRRLMDEACAWLADQGLDGARAGWGGANEFPFVIDDDDTLPPSFSRQNPRYYHSLLKDAGFESERGWVDYKIRVTPALVERYTSAVDAARLQGFDIVPLGRVAEERRVDDFVQTWNDAFRAHWAMTPWTREEFDLIHSFLGPAGMSDTSVLAYEAGQPVGALFVVPESTAGAVTAEGRQIRDDERLNFLGIGVRERARGRGVNMAMAAYAYLELIRRGATHLSYTLVLDDNWPSRRTAEKLGAYVWANYMVYRRNFRGRR